MVTSDQYRHVPTGTLAVLAQRLGKVFASPSTWYRLARLYKRRRPRRRIHPSKPTVGIRASATNEIWHVDTTLIRLLDGTRAYLHAVIDNFSRRILAWKVSANVGVNLIVSRGEVAAYHWGCDAITVATIDMPESPSPRTARAAERAFLAARTAILARRTKQTVRNCGNRCLKPPRP